MHGQKAKEEVEYGSSVFVLVCVVGKEIEGSSLGKNSITLSLKKPFLGLMEWSTTLL